MRTTTVGTDDGNFILRNERVDTHQVGQKKIPSNFFTQPLTENISAILYSNSLTVSKFTRMAYCKGYFTEGLRIKREGFYYPLDDQVLLPPRYSYFLDDPSAHQETWAESLIVFLNPNAKNPLPRDFFMMLLALGFLMVSIFMI